MDFHYVLILALAIWNNLGYQTNACSVLPGGSPRCFQDEEDSTTDHERKQREIDFSGDNSMYGFIVNSGRLDDSVRLGEHWEESADDGVDTVLCQRDFMVDSYKPEYETKLYDYRREKTVPFNVIGNAPVTTLFVITKKEVWHCSAKVKIGANLEFTRVVTEMVSKEVLGQVYFFDGTEITTVPIPSTEDEKRNTAVVREIKYLRPETNTVLKYEGKLVFYEPEDYTDYGVFERLGKKMERGPDELEGYQRDVTYASKVPQSFGLNRHHPEDGLIFTDDQRTVGAIGQSDDRAACEMLTEDSRLYNEKLLPYWNYWTNPDGYYEPRTIFTFYFKDYFIVLKHELWICNIENKETFLRSVLEYIGKAPLNRIEYFDNNSVWEYGLTGQSRSVAVRAVHYYKDDNLLLTFEYSGLVKLIELEQESFANMKDKFHSSKSERFIVSSVQTEPKEEN